jgi:uncharacterized coiled-coil protein SlyX
MQTSDPTFYIGRTLDLFASSKTETAMQPLRYNPDDLTTHAVIVGMTGSGKTGLLINLLEEAALRGLPSIVIDPKGDLTNLLLHFPDLLPASFEPWIDPETARRQNLSVPQLAEITANRWREGLQNWDLDRDELLALRDAVDYVVFTPGSTAGVQVNLLSSFAPPRGLNWDDHREILRERIAATVTALLGLVGLKDIDPLRSREHILLSNILENAWGRGQSLDLTELILQTQNPPFDRLGAFAVNSFFPEKDRLALALLLNNFLASPSFQTWTEGQAIEVDDFLYTPQRKPRMSIFYLAHLDENERMFFVTLLLASVESWMRAQRGSTGLRAVLAFDEIVGYLPPIANPPSRTVLLRLLKQARAFGLGLLLATQNPVDLDYKGLSNAGTWFIGRLQTERDKMRLLEGLQSIEGGVETADYDRAIAALRPRVFLLHNIHNPAGAQTFQTRWCLNYLAGPLSRAQLADLKPLGLGFEVPEPPEAAQATTAPVVASQPIVRPPTAVRSGPSGGLPPETAPREAARPALEQPAYALSDASLTPPSPPAAISAYFLTPPLSLGQAFARLGGSFSGPVRPEGILYRPALLCQAEVRYYNRTYNLDHATQTAALLTSLQSARPDWQAAAREPFDPQLLDNQPLPDARFVPLPGWLSSAKGLAALQKDFLDTVYRAGSLRLLANTALKLYSTPDDSQASFRQKCADVAREALNAESEKLADAFDARLDALERRITRQKMNLRKLDDVVNQRRMEELSTGAEVFLSVFSKRKRSLSSSVTKHRLTSQAQSDQDTADKVLEGMLDAYEALKEQRAEALALAQERWARAAAGTSEFTVAPMRKNVFLQAGGIIWLPAYILTAEGQPLEAPAY